MSISGREFDVVLWGATGFTGRLVAEHFARHYRDERSLRWAIGGRDRDRLRRLASTLGLSSAESRIVVGDSSDRASLEEMVDRTSVVCSTVGPYARYGSNLLAACVNHGTHYCDLCGEVPWMREMLDHHQSRARETGARIVHCCGFDSIPSDLGCYLLQKHVKESDGVVCRHVKLRVRRMRGAFSGGTVASLLGVIEQSRRDKRVQSIVEDPYALNPAEARKGPDGRDPTTVAWDDDFGAWTAPFVMAAINTRVVRRTNAVLGFPYGHDFRYDEAVLMGGGAWGWTTAKVASGGMKLFRAAVSAKPSRDVFRKWVLPRPGQGPSAEARAKGFFNMQLIGKPDPRSNETWSLIITGDQDPGYGCTSKMLAESAACLVEDAERLAVSGGFWTPAACFGETLVPRLELRAGMRFSFERFGLWPKPIGIA